MVSHFFGLAFSFSGALSSGERKNHRIRDRNPFTERCAAPLLCLKKRQGPGTGRARKFGFGHG